nr:unnamed protein product [Callosobruchus analis]
MFHVSCAKNSGVKNVDKNSVICCEIANEPDDAAFFDAIASVADEKKLKDVIVNELNENYAKHNGRAKKCTNKYSQPGKKARDEAPAKSSKIKAPVVIQEVEDELSSRIPTQKGHASASQQSEWQIVNRRKLYKPRQSLVVGNKDCDMIKGVPKYVDLHVSRISPEISKEVLYQLLKEEFPEIKCETLNSKNAGIYSSFRVSIYGSNLSRAMNHNSWPLGACINRFLYRCQRTKQCLVFGPSLLLLNINTMSVNKIYMFCTDISTYKDFLCLGEIGVE